MTTEELQEISDKLLLDKATQILLYVRNMREAQVSYFKTRSSKDLQASKRAESLIDRLLKEYGDLLRDVRAQGHQIPLFGGKGDDEKRTS
jgi:hypothetical protein